VTEPDAAAGTPPPARSNASFVDDQTLRLVDMAIAEDRGPGDWTSRWTVPARTRAHAEIVAKAAGVIAGLAVARAVFARIDPRITFQPAVSDGADVEPGAVVATVRGPARAVLTAERVALNFLQRLSGVATLTRRYVDAVAGTGVRILDTRKTTPGWRTLEKAAVRAGGGANHRLGLWDMVLVKDNHQAIAGGVAEAMARVTDQNTRGLPVEVEVRDAGDLAAALDYDVDRILLDNMSIEAMAEAVRLVRSRRPDGRTRVEASGNMTLERVRAVAETGVDDISVGALTHSAPALDLSLRIVRS
jgi:nicotinate-nucleotide pyrophosphorylase (carboxylating)